MTSEPLTFVTFDAPQHDGLLYTCSRPLPGRFIGFRDSTGFFVFDVENDEGRRRECDQLDGYRVLLVSEAGLEALVEERLNAVGYSMADYRALGDGWGDVTKVAAEHGIRLITIRECGADDPYYRQLMGIGA